MKQEKKAEKKANYEVHVLQENQPSDFVFLESYAPYWMYSKRL
jgi:hypothetical protein